MQQELKLIWQKFDSELHIFDNCICHQNCRLEIVLVAASYGQYNTHGVQEQLKLLSVTCFSHNEWLPCLQTK